MIFWWQIPANKLVVKELKAQNLSTRLINIMMNHECKSLAEFLDKFTLDDMDRLREFGRKTHNEVLEEAAKRGLTVRRAPPTIKPEKDAPLFPQDNSLFLCAGGQVPGVTLKIGSKDHGRRIHLTEDGALKLAYRLMSLARGGETRGMETFA